MGPILLRARNDRHHIQMRHQHHGWQIRVLSDPSEKKALAESLWSRSLVEIGKSVLHPTMHGLQRHGLFVLLDAIAIGNCLEAHGLGKMPGDSIRIDGNRWSGGLF